MQVRPGASPADTLEAYQRAMGYRERALKGEDFFALSSEEVHRVQPDAPKNEYEGELNCFTAFDMVYPFEEGAYALKEGEISRCAAVSDTISSSSLTRWSCMAG